LVTDGQNGYVLDRRDVGGLTDCLRLLARDESLRARLSAAAPGTVANLGYSSFAENVARLYSRVLVQ
jgi:glycosyltransferase involved in cell wall biosynthesis